ncbi:SBBP repeat-containing protein, partial [Actinoallomurus sp. NPDC050550]|uniref:SBBP repeat-containing protein n=1 Tax=Actinoallomurus sp. NPDC050550 TaxID=3154937 RepID=UPI0033C9689D
MAVKDRAAAAFGRLPLAFEPNRGQTAAQVRYLAHGPGYGVFITAVRTVLTLAPRSARGAVGRAPQAAPGSAAAQAGRGSAPGTGVALSFRAVGGNAHPQMVAGDRFAGGVNYLRGRDRAGWRTNLPTYGQVTERGVYPGVDLRWSGTQRGLDYDVTMAPNADPGVVHLAVDGMRGQPRLNSGGDLVLPTTVGDVVQRAPRAYQVIDGRSHPVAARYALSDRNDVGFAVGAYDHQRPLIIQPRLVYSTYLGRTGGNEGLGIAVDSAGNAYLTGFTNSVNLPVTAGAFQTTLAGGADVFVTKLNPTGTALVYSTYLGGTRTDNGFAIAVDSAGNAYLTGATNSVNFPVTAGAFQTTYGGGTFDAFVTKLNPTGTGLAYSTYLGGTRTDKGFAIAVDSAGNAYLTGATNSVNFPVTAGAFQTTYGGDTFDAFVTKLNPTGTGLAYSTYLGGTLGGTHTDNGFGIAVDGTGNAYVTGVTNSVDFPVTSGAFQIMLAGGADVFVTKLNPTGTALVYSTYLGGTRTDNGFAIAVDSAGNAYLTGATDSVNFPVTAGAFQTTYGGGTFDAFVTKLNPTGTGLAYSTYLGGTRTDQGPGIAVDGTGNAYVTGATNSVNFPVTAGAFQTTYGGGTFDAFVTKLNPTGTALVYSTYLGGTRTDNGFAIAV